MKFYRSCNEVFRYSFKSWRNLSQGTSEADPRFAGSLCPSLRHGPVSCIAAEDSGTDSPTDIVRLLCGGAWDWMVVACPVCSCAQTLPC